MNCQPGAAFSAVTYRTRECDTPQFQRAAAFRVRTRGDLCRLAERRQGAAASLHRARGQRPPVRLISRRRRASARPAAPRPTPQRRRHRRGRWPPPPRRRATDPGHRPRHRESATERDATSAKPGRVPWRALGGEQSRSGFARLWSRSRPLSNGRRPARPDALLVLVTAFKRGAGNARVRRSKAPSIAPDKTVPSPERQT